MEVMFVMNKNIALIPAYKPDQKLIKLISELQLEKFIIVVVNDGSGADYDNIFDSIKKKVVLLNHDENQGKGAALKTGLKYIKDNFNKRCIIVTMDADGQHTVSDAKKLCKALDHDNTLICGKRIRNKSVPFRSKAGNAITRFVFRLFTHNDVYDTQTGLRAFSYNLIPYLLSIKGNRYEYEINVLLFAGANNVNIKEIEIKTIYIDDNASSHFNPFKDSIKIYSQILKFGLSSIMSFLIDYLLYILFNVFLNSITLANIFSRAISSTFNYLFNRNIVFKNKDSVLVSSLKYFVLVIFILVFNTLLLNLVVNKINVDKYLAKIIIEFIFFFVSFFIQKKFIFKGKK